MQGKMNILLGAKPIWRRRGHGVHSPWAYGWLKHVFNRKFAYYSEQNIKGLCNARPLGIKDMRMVIRTAGYLSHCDAVRVMGPLEAITQVEQIMPITYEADTRLTVIVGQQYIPDKRMLAEAVANGATFLFFAGGSITGWDEAVYSVWNECNSGIFIKGTKRVLLSGMAVCHTSQKQHYCISI